MEEKIEGFGHDDAACKRLAAAIIEDSIKCLKKGGPQAERSVVEPHEGRQHRPRKRPEHQQVGARPPHEDGAEQPPVEESAQG